MSNDLIFVQWSTPDAWHVMTDDRKYVLLGSPDENIRFEVNIDGSENKAGITGRNLFSDDPEQGYNPFLVQKLDKLSPKCQIVEIGAGMGELVPYLIRQGNVETPPIVVDPADYGLMIRMLEYARLHVPDERERLDELSERCKIISDPAKVTLINNPLLDVLPESISCLTGGDILVDNWGAAHCAYQLGEDQYNEVIAMEIRLLRQGGIYYSQWPGKPRIRKGDKLVKIE